MHVIRQYNSAGNAHAGAPPSGTEARVTDIAHASRSRLLRTQLNAALQQSQPPRTVRNAVITRAQSTADVADAAWSTNKLILLRPLKAQPASSHRPLLIYLPGSDGTGQAITPQLPGLYAAGFDVRSLFIPLSDRSSWDQLTEQTVELLRQLLASNTHDRVTVVGESFGGCLALRVALAAPELLERLVLVNPATCFDKSLGGLSSLIASTNLLSIFPSPLYAAAQAVLVPMLLDRQRVDPATTEAVKDMMLMSPPTAFRVPESISEVRALQLEGEEAAALFLPSATASWRLNLLRSGGLPDHRIASLDVPLLLVASAEDRLLPSLMEASRIQRLVPQARRVVLPDSGHTALLEAGVDLAAIMQRSGIMSDTSDSSLASRARSGAAGSAPSTENDTVPVSAPLNEAALVRDSENGNGSGAATVDGYLAPNGVEEAAILNGNGTVNGNGNGNGNGSDSNGYSRMSVTDAEAAVLASAVPAAAVNSAPAPAGAASPAEPPAELISDWVAKRVPDIVARIPAIPATSAAAALDGSAAQPAAAAASSGPGAVHSSVGHATAPSRREHPSIGRWSAADEAVEGGIEALTPLRRLISPVVSGIESLPDPLVCGRPLLFVGNHTQFGLYDLPLLVVELYLRGYRVRGLADPRHWMGPLGPMFEGFGAVKASPMAAARLLRQGEAVLLFPGGAREVAKRKGEKYKLFWREDRADFVRLAAKFNALIVPFAAVGGDDAFDLFMDTDELLATPLVGDLARRLVQQLEPGSDPADTVPPIASIPGLPVRLPTLLPIANFARLYFRFLEPIDTAQLDVKDEAECRAVYESVRIAVEGGMAALQARQSERAADPRRDLVPRLQQAISKWLPAFDLMRERRGNSA